MATIKEILQMSVENRKTVYKADGIGTVIIDGNRFTDYKAFSFVWEKSYVKSPTRSGDGTIGNLNSYSTFVTPHLKIDFSLLSIDSYRRLMNLIYSKNEFTVTCYDIVNNRRTANKMYFATEEMPKLWAIARELNGEQWVEVLGVQDYTVEMIGTNADLDTVDILYYDNNGNLIAEATKKVVKGTEAIINYNFIAPTGYRFDGDWETEIGGIVQNGEARKVNQELKLTAIVVPTNQYVLSFNYGNGNVPISAHAGEVVNVPIKQNETLSTAITNAKILLSDGTLFAFPANGTGAKTIVYDGKSYEGRSVWSFNGWYWTTEANDKTKVTGDTVFNSSINRTIYQIYEPIPHSVVYVTNASFISLDTQYIGYGEKVLLPKLAKDGYIFDGWYTTSDFQDGTLFSGTMPPYAITLYARWVENQ